MEQNLSHESHLPPPESSKGVPLEMYTLLNQSEPITQRALDRYLSCHKQNALIQEAAIIYKKNDFKTKIKETPKKERSALIEQKLQSDNFDDQIEGAEMIRCYASDFTKKILIEQALDSKSIEVQEQGAAAIPAAPPWERFLLINKILTIIEGNLTNADENKQLEGATLLRYFPRVSLIEQALKSKYTTVKMKGIQSISQVKNEQKTSLIKKATKIAKEGLESDNTEEQVLGMKIMKSLPIESLEPLRRIIRTKRLTDLALESPLYLDRTISSSYPERQSFVKTGSELTVIGGNLKGKTIIRSIRPESFLAWQKLYEIYQVWKQEGFNYVPIEPIQTYHFNKEKNLVDVFSGVLDMNLADWRARFGLFEEELESQVEKITDVLISQGVDHKHQHYNNFALSFFHKQDGSIDITKVPRLYLIDFDQATLFL